MTFIYFKKLDPGCFVVPDDPTAKLNEDEYEPADPQASNAIKAVRAALILAPGCDETERIVYWKKKKEDETEDNRKYKGNSLTLAYLLALISRSKKFSFGTCDEVWCTGIVDIHEKTKPCLENDYPSHFSCCLNEFLSQEKSRLFIVPAANVPGHEVQIEKHNAKLLSLHQLRFYDLLNHLKFHERKKTILRVHWGELELLMEKVFADPSSISEKKRIHFAYPNVNVEDSSFLGIGKYVSLSSDTPEYRIAAPKDKDDAKVVQAALILAPDSDKTNRHVYERDVSKKYEGNSLELAYLLALISRSRKLRLKRVGDIWCTGVIDIKGLSKPVLTKVSYETTEVSRPFIVKLENFLSQEDSRLFILPAANISGCKTLCEEKNVEVLSLNQFRPSVQRKTILKVQGGELDLLVKKIFKPKLSLPSLPEPRTMLLVIFATSLLLWAQAFEFIYLDSKIERHIISLGDVFMEKSFRNDIALIAIEDENFDISWRERHAMLTDKLSQAGARIIAFDIYFQDAGKFDNDFVGAIEWAEKKGTDIIVGFSAFQGNEPNMIKGLEKAVEGKRDIAILDKGPAAGHQGKQGSL